MQIFESIDSTQLEARRQIDIKKHIVEDVIFAREQTSGITTKENLQWLSKRGDLNFTIILNKDSLAQSGNCEVNWLPFCAGLAVVDNLLLLFPTLKLFLKFPNDTLAFDETSKTYKKIHGTLSEMYKGHFVCGIGCNLVSFPDKTEHFRATSIEELTGTRLDCIEFGLKIFESLNNNIKTLQQFGFAHIKNRWKKYAYMLGDYLLLRDGTTILFEDITDDGYILGKMQNNDNRVIISSNEVIGGGSAMTSVVE